LGACAHGHAVNPTGLRHTTDAGRNEFGADRKGTEVEMVGNPVRAADPVVSGNRGRLVPVLAAAEDLRRQIAALVLPEDLPELAELREERQRLLGRLDAYVLPRLRRMEAPLLVVIGGSTGAGKSTLANTLVGLSISPTGVIRPTTRLPVLVHHPKDAFAFQSRRILPQMSRRSLSDTAEVHRAAQDDSSAGEILLVANESVPRGLAVIDSPDLDSHVEANRELATRLFEVADLWVFVTTGIDYADAVPWRLLAQAAARQISVAVVLDRVRDSEVVAVRAHFATMLRDHGLGSAPLFTIAETVLSEGKLPQRLVAPLQNWLVKQAADVVTRDGHVGRAVRGGLNEALSAVPRLAQAATDRALVSRQARTELEGAFAEAVTRTQQILVDGSSIDEDLRSGWSEVVGNPAEAGAEGGRLRRRRIHVALRGDTRYQAIAEVLDVALTRVLLSGIDGALTATVRAWEQRPETSSALVRNPNLLRRSPDLGARVSNALRQWHIEVAERVTQAGARSRSPIDPAVVAMASLAVGADRDWVGEAARRVLAAEIPGFDPTESLAEARNTLMRKVWDLFAVERARVEEVLTEVVGDEHGARELIGVAENLRTVLARSSGLSS
jgi:energy-coupling factor transporter ATP-binding protein EcfA2